MEFLLRPYGEGVSVLTKPASTLRLSNFKVTRLGCHLSGVSRQKGLVRAVVLRSSVLAEILHLRPIMVDKSQKSPDGVDCGVDYGGVRTPEFTYLG